MRRIVGPRILLTGGSGFVGQRLAHWLNNAFDQGSRLTLFGRGSPSTNLAELTGDVTDQRAVDAAVIETRPDIIVHLAAQSSIGAAQVETEATWRTNFGGSLAVASACARHAPTATVLFASSAEVYGASFRDGSVDETATLQPQNAYSRSKAAAEQVLADLLAPTNQLIITRAFNHTGAGQDERFVLPSFAGQIARMEFGVQAPVMRVGNLDAQRDFLHVDDVCEAYLLLLRVAHTLPSRIAFNVSSGTVRSIRSVLDDMRALSKIEFTIEVDPLRARASDIPRASGRNEKLRETTGWQPKVPMSTILAELIDAARARVTVKLNV